MQDSEYKQTPNPCDFPRFFHPGVCCDHDWTAKHFERKGRGEYDDTCARCGNTAIRDGRDGSIIFYQDPKALARS